MNERKIFDLGAFWCDLLDRLLLAKARSTRITRKPHEGSPRKVE
jgi:hypothetical protein